VTTYADLRTKFLSRIKRRDCTDALADGFIADSIKRIQRVIRIPGGEKSVSIELTDETYFDEGNLAIPSDFIKLKHMWYNGDTELVRKPLSLVRAMAVAGDADTTPNTGTSRYFARQGSGWVFAPYPEEDATIRVDYWAEFEDADEDTDETLLIDIAEDLIIYGALSYACDHWIDKRGPAFEARFTQILSDLQEQGDSDELTSACVEQGFTYPSDID
jgi:hypothetical protein